MTDIRQKMSLGAVRRFRFVLGVPQLRFRTLCFRDVARDAEGADDRAVAIAERHFGRRDPRLMTIGPDLVFFMVDQRLAGLDDSLFVRLRVVRFFFRKKVTIRLAERFVGAIKLQQVRERLIDSQEASAAVLKED